MRILLACNIKTDGTGNPYTLQLLHNLVLHPDAHSVQHGTSWMYVPEAEFDVVHVQWPEALVGWDEPSEVQIEQVRETLIRWKETASLVVTIHNEYPHYSDTILFEKLYRTVYKYSDGIIHLGEASKEVVRSRYQDEMNKAEETVIPHGDYSWFPNEISKTKARSILNISNDENVFLCFGTLRSSEELNLLLRGFNLAQIPNRRLLIAGQLPHGRSRKKLRYWTTRIPLWMHKRIKVIDSFIPQRHVQQYLNAADVVVIPRHTVLNSGNVALGFTFGRVVVGPNAGVVGETLRKTGNPLFDPDNPPGLAEAMEDGVECAKQARGEANAAYANDKMAWPKIKDEHISFYKTVK